MASRRPPRRSRQHNDKGVIADPNAVGCERMGSAPVQDAQEVRGACLWAPVDQSKQELVLGLDPDDGPRTTVYDGDGATAEGSRPVVPRHFTDSPSREHPAAEGHFD
jgi:hypothetical protein